MKHRTSSLATLLAALLFACNGTTTSSSATGAGGAGSGGTASAPVVNASGGAGGKGGASGGSEADSIGMGAADTVAGAEQGGSGGSGGSGGARGRYACPGVLGGAGTFGEVASGGAGGVLNCAVGQEYCEFDAYAGESGQAPGGVPFCIDFTASAPACSDTPNCACLCSHGTCDDLCSCTDVDGLAVVYCQGI